MSDHSKLEKRLERYLQSEEFQEDIGALVNDYCAQGLPVPSEEQLREEAAAEARKCLETMMVCEAKGHLWKETADPENGTSTLSCRRCGAEEHLQCESRVEICKMQLKMLDYHARIFIFDNQSWQPGPMMVIMALTFNHPVKCRKERFGKMHI